MIRLKRPGLDTPPPQGSQADVVNPVNTGLEHLLFKRDNNPPQEDDAQDGAYDAPQVEHPQSAAGAA